MTLQKNNILPEIVIIRLGLIIFLVLDHCFAPFCGIWETLSDEAIPLYHIIGRFAYSFFLETFVFISGYLLAYSAQRTREALNAGNCIWKKFKRLYIPSLVFSAIYVALFTETFLVNDPKNWYYIVQGAGHMWFLPMLFWCFVFFWAVNKLKISPIVILFISLFTGFLPVGLPFRIGYAAYYFFFFYFGYAIRSGFLQFVPKKPSSTLFLSGVVLFFIGFIITILYPSSCNIFKISKLIMSVCAVIIIYWLSLYYSYKIEFLSPILIRLSGYCFGVYIVQQFFIIYFYYHTSASLVLNIYLLPWITFVITIIVSLIVTHLMLKTKIGRFLVG